MFPECADTSLLVLSLLRAPRRWQVRRRPPVRGFFAEGAKSQRECEKRFQAVPNPDNLRDYMKTIAAEPHHAGGPGSRKVAKYVLAKFRSWGLNASIEEFEPLRQ